MFNCSEIVNGGSTAIVKFEFSVTFALIEFFMTSSLMPIPRTLDSVGTDIFANIGNVYECINHSFSI